MTTPNPHGAPRSRRFDSLRSVSMAEAEQLADVVDAQVEVFRSRPARAPGPSLTIIGVDGDRTEQLRCVDESIADAVLGFELPARFTAVLAVAESVVATRAARFTDALLAVAVSRSGLEICMLGTEAGITPTHEPRGWLVDACRRAVTLPTRPSQAHPLALPIAVWLDQLMLELVHGAGEGDSTWAAASTRCPVPGAWRSMSPEELGATMASVTPSWHSMRHAAVAGAPLPVPVRPGHAAWMDDPMFARWCLGFFPDVDELRNDIEFLAPFEIAEGVARTIDHALRCASVDTVSGGRDGDGAA